MRNMFDTEEIIRIIKDIIDKEGPAYIEHEPGEVYRRLISEGVEASYARMVLVTLLSGTPTKACKLGKELLSKEIQKDCYLKKSMADKLAELYTGLYDKENLSAWDKKKLAGFKEFCRNEWSFDWEGKREWHRNGGFVICTCEVDVEIRVVDNRILKTALNSLLKKNPFITSEEILRSIEKELIRVLEADMEEYVNADDYYEPWMEDYDCRKVIEDFCAEKGLELIGYNCEGDTSDWESEGRW